MAEEQTPVEETQVEEITTTTETLLPEPEQTETPVAVTDGWALAEGIPGEGDQPEWFKGEKYKSVADQAKGREPLVSLVVVRTDLFHRFLLGFCDVKSKAQGHVLP